VTTPDPFASTPDPGAQQPGQPPATQWQASTVPSQQPPTAPSQPDYATYDYGQPASASTYAQPAPGFSQQATDASAAQAQPTYAGAYQPAYGTPGSQGTDGTSIAALVTGVLGLGAVATILGAIGLRKTADGTRKGTGMAWAGVILGILGTIGWSLAAAWFIAGAAIVTSSGLEFDDLEGSTDIIFSDADTYGDDPELDALWDGCAAGDMAACDDLYFESPLNSEYEEFGDTCGGLGRPDGQVWCEY